jgi:drug/metabolite transporter, DME family
MATVKPGVLKAGAARLRGLDSRIVGYIFVLLAAALWGSLGIIYNTLKDAYGVPTDVTVFYRAFFAALGLFAYLGLRNRPLLRLPLRQLPLLLGYALIGITVFYSVYGRSTTVNTVAVAAVLMYTAPAFVTLYSWRFWGEPLDRRKVSALLLTFVGCALVAQLYAATQLNFNWLGLILGLGSGLLYASYTISANQGLRNGLAPLTVVFYAQALGAIGLLVLVALGSGGPASIFAAGSHWQAWALLVTAGLVNTLAAAGFYVSGLARIETGAASIASTFELVCATAFGFIFLAQSIDGWQALGGLLVVAALILLARSKSSPPSEKVRIG